MQTPAILEAVDSAIEDGEGNSLPPSRPPTTRRLPIGAEVVSEGVHFRVWAPRCKKVRVVLEGEHDHRQTASLEPEPNGYFSGLIRGAKAGSLYRYALDGRGPFPDPASRFQPAGPHGPSQVIDPQTFRWTDQEWKGRREGHVLYEMHIGTCTKKGDLPAATAALDSLRDLGITTIEVMPLADFPGRFGWGYDGVNLFAPTRLYGNPDDVRRFVDRAHALGLAVILDVVYNHIGPDGNFLKEFAESYFTDRYKNEWGEAINFDGPDAGPVREFVLANVRYWIDEFHMDGYRLDATQQIFDASERHILAELTEYARQIAAGKSIYIISENEPQKASLVRPQQAGGFGMDALWNDDFHHTAMVALTGRNDAYYSDYLGTPQEFISALKWGFLYQGQFYSWQKDRRGSPSLDLPPSAFVQFMQNHDQVANSGSGERCHLLTSPGRFRAFTALLLLGPQTPLLFQGQEFAASSPFFYFADHNPELVKLVAAGRADFLSQFRNLATPEMQARLPDPGDPNTFESCKLDNEERQRDRHAQAYELHRDLLRLRREDPVFSKPRRRGLDGSVLGPDVFALRFFAENGDDRLMLINLGRQTHLNPSPEPLLAPPADKMWDTLWSSEDPRYGGQGTPALETENNWHIPGEAAVVMRPIAPSAGEPEAAAREK